MSHRVSVITPSFNQGRFIERTVQSVLSQEMADLEYIVVDGGSTDDTVAILERYTSQLRWVSEPDEGQADAVNKGLRVTSGDIIGWLNSDDVYYPGALRTACDFLASHPDVDVVYGEAHHIDVHDAVIESYNTEPWDLERLYDVCFLCQPAVFFRRAVVTRYGALDKRLRYCLDYEYWLRLGLGGARFAHLPQALAGSRFYAETKTLGARVPVHREINDMLRAHLGRVPDRWLFNYAHVLADARGLERTGKFPFVLAISLRALAAALRWNRGVSAAMLRTIAHWLGGSTQLAFREVFTR